MSDLSRASLRKLPIGGKAYERGVVYERLDGDGRWSVNVMVNGVRHRFVVGLESEGFTKTQAEDAIAALKVSKRERKHGVRPGNAKSLTFADAVQLYVQHQRDTGGKNLARKEKQLALHIVPALGHLALSALTKTDLQKYRTRRKVGGASDATVNRELAVVSHLLRTAADPDALNLLSAVPCRIPRVREREREPKYLGPDEAARLLEAAAEDPNPHLHAFVMVGLHTGMRLSAILRLRLDEIDFERRVLWVNRDKAGERQQAMTGELAEFLRAHTRGLEGPWLFPGPKSRTGHAVNLYKPFLRALKAAGLPHEVGESGRRPFVIHSLRHSFATNAAHAGVDAATLQTLGGWKSRRMVEKYTHANAMQDAMDKLQKAYASGTVTAKLPRRKSETA